MKFKIITVILISIFCSPLLAERWTHPATKPLPFKNTQGPYVHLSDGSILSVIGDGVIITKDMGQIWSKPRVMYNGPGPGRPTTGGGRFVRTNDGVLVYVYYDMENYKLIWTFGYEPIPPGEQIFELFDLAADPEELENLYDTRREIANELFAKLKLKFDQLERSYQA